MGTSLRFRCPFRRPSVVTTLHEIGYDPLDRPIGSRQSMGHLSKAWRRFGYTKQNVGVVAQRYPPGSFALLPLPTTPRHLLTSVKDNVINHTTGMSCVICLESIACIYSKTILMVQGQGLFPEG